MKSILGVCAAIVAVTLFFLAFRWYSHPDEIVAPSVERAAPATIDARSATPDGPPPDTEPETRTRPSTAAATEEAAETYRGPGGVVYVPNTNGQPPAYRIVDPGEDPRFAAGDIVTHVDGAPVEVSAAGSELFLIALMNRDAQLTIVSRP